VANTASQQSFEQLKAWLDRCLREHRPSIHAQVRQKGQYVRVGYKKRSEEKDSSRTLEQAYQLASNAKLLDEDEYEDFDGKAQIHH
jgi:hypothetical protein